MLWKCSFRLGLVALLGGAAAVQAQSAPLITLQPIVRSGPVSVAANQKPDSPVGPGAAQTPAVGPGQGTPAPRTGTPAPGAGTSAPGAGTPGTGVAPSPGAASPGNTEGKSELAAADQGATPPAAAALGPTPLLDVKIFQKLLTDDDPKPWLHVAGWADFDYTYRSTGHGINNVAPVMNRFGDEFLNRQLGLYLFKPLDETTWSWGFNSIFIGGADASFLTPIAGGYKNTNPRFGSDFTDLNLTFHLPILTEGGVDVKAGRQTTVLGPMGALPWQRYFDSSDYAWYNMEEGRFTGVSAVWHVNKQLDLYNGFEEGWGSFFDDYTTSVDYIGQISYWLDKDAKKTKVFTTVLTGPTSQRSGANTTTFELGVQHNYNDYVYQIVDTQMVFSKGPVNGLVPPGYNENAYDVYTYLGTHIDKCLDLNSRFEWYDDVNGRGYAGGFGNGRHTQYFEVTLGPDYHPYKWIQFRPEIRYDYATHDNFGRLNDRRNQLELAAEMLFKF